MKTIYVTRRQWQEHTLEGELEQAAGGGIAEPRRRDGGLWAGGDKVIDFAAWKAENLVELEDPAAADARPSRLAQYEGRELVRRRRRKHEALQARAELAATLAVVGVMAALILRVLVF